MTNYTNFTIVCFNITCFIFTFFVTYDQFKKYLKNEDTSSYKIRNYRKTADNQYPDISICFSNRLSLNSANSYDKYKFPILFDSWGQNELVYLTQDGHVNEGYSLRNITNSKENLEFPPIEQNTTGSLQHHWLLEAFGPSWVVSSNTEYDKYFKMENRFQQPKAKHLITWLDAGTVCVTRQITYTSFDVMERQMIQLKPEKMQIFDFFWIVIHPPHQLIRTLGSSSIAKMIGTATYRGIIPTKYNKATNLVDVYLTNVKMVQRRPKTDDPCDEFLKDDDEKWMDHAVSGLECIPIFWGNSTYNSKAARTFPNCNEHNQYQQALKFSRDTDIIHDKYAPPCKTLVSTSHFDVASTEAEKLTSEISNPLIEQKSILIRIRYKMKNFEEIINKRAFTGWDLFGQVGGIIGLILGFSFLQIPNCIMKLSMVSRTKPK